MTVREWLATRSPTAPAPLRERMMAILGARADALVERGPDAFLEAARTELARLLDEKQFGRDGALDLLAVDALMTFAFELGAEHAGGARDLEALTRRGVDIVAPLATANG